MSFSAKNQLLVGCVALAGAFGFQFYQNQLLRSEMSRAQSQLMEMSAAGSTPKGEKEKQDPYVVREIKNTIVKNAKLLQECWFAHLEKFPAQKKGKLFLDWTVSTTGEPTSVEVVRSEFDDEAFGKCTTEKIAKFHFPAPPWDRPKYIEYTLSFEKEEDAAATQAPSVELITTQNQKLTESKKTKAQK
ncbi:MAG: AgmX/PglI C-terminal domain-containing protein [Bdellovibrionales bacterium]|nr:AgmX/PglI C-terminal domain-containing protein [Bdellovibrionales bacterium]